MTASARSKDKRRRPPRAAAMVQAVVDTSSVDTLWPPSRLHTLRTDMLWADPDPVRTSCLDVEAMNTSRVDTAAISGTAVGGITAFARAGGGWAGSVNKVLC